MYTKSYEVITYELEVLTYLLHFQNFKINPLENEILLKRFLFPLSIHFFFFFSVENYVFADHSV